PLVGSVCDFRLRNQFRASDVTGVIGSFVAHIDNHRLIPVQQILQLSSGNAARPVGGYNRRRRSGGLNSLSVFLFGRVTAALSDRTQKTESKKESNKTHR